MFYLESQFADGMIAHARAETPNECCGILAGAKGKVTRLYRATNAVYCGMTRGGRVEGFVRDGQRRSMRCGPRTWTVRELKEINARAYAEDKPEPIRLIRAGRMHRYCWAMGKPLARRPRHRTLVQRMKPYRFVPVWQPRLLAVFRRRLLSGAAQW